MGKGTLHNQHGFTLAELLLSIAILGVLAALAMPSIFNAQRNMQMVELDSAAEQIALAAQNQMTSMKVSGTWLPTLDEFEDKGDANKIAPAEALPADAGADIFYLTAQQAKDLRIITPLSIEEAVYDGDFIIEFRKSTASVCGVFFADGRAGFFSNAQTQNGAGSYYDAMTSADAREQSARLDASPLVGYYWGTPAGATEAVALRNPNIWVDESGMLRIENVNETDHPDWGTSVQATIETKDGTGKFVLGGMQKNGTTYSVGLVEDSSSSEPFDNNDIYELIARDNNATSPVNVYQIDLNKLLEVLKKDGSANLKKQLEAFAPGVDIKVTAQVKAANKPSIPATATAFIVWPEQVAKLTILATGVDESIPEYGPNGPRFGFSLATKRDAWGYKADKDGFVPVTLVTRDLKPPVNAPRTENASDNIAIEGTSENLKNRDPGAGAQYYKGKRVDLKAIEDNTILFQINPGNIMNINNRGERYYYYYQIYEIWINDYLVGSIQGVNWQWNKEFVTKGLFLENTGEGLRSVDAVMPMLDANNTAIYLDPAKLLESRIPAVDEGYTLYVRSAPGAKDVEHYLNVNVANIPGNASSRNTEGLSNDWRVSFLNRFHTPSSVALWAIKKGTIPGISASKDNDICFYYAPTPFAKGKKSLDGSPLASSVMWALKTTEEYFGSTYGLYYDYLAVGQDYSKVVPPPTGLGEVARPQVDPLGSADFAIRTDTPELYYRSITYYEAAEKPYPNIPAQWEPIVGFNVVEGQPVTNADAKFPNAPAKEGHAFKGWTANPDGSGTLFPAGDLLSNHRNELPLGTVKLYAQYRKLGLGLMYLEWMSDGSVLYEGYTGDKPEKVSNFSTFDSPLKRNDTVNTFGYYVVVKKGQQPPQLDKSTNPSKNLYLEGKGTITLDGAEYDYYAIKKNWYTEAIDATDAFRGDRYATLRFGFEQSDMFASYNVNLNYARMVDDVSGGETGVADMWGGSELFPFVVRHAKQFPGTFTTSGSIQDSNVGSGYFFAQQRNINAADRPTANKIMNPGQQVKFNEVFRGTYDGGEYRIDNFRHWIGSYVTNYEYKNGEESKKVNGQGVFSIIENSTIKGIRLKDTSNADWDVTQEGGAGFSFGCLVGAANNSTIENCYINDREPVSRVRFFTTAATSGPSVGGLVGYAIASKVVGCGVENITVSIDKKTDFWNNDILAVGGLVGQLVSQSTVSAGNRDQAQVSGFVFQSNYRPGQYAQRGRFGSLVGLVENSDVEGSQDRPISIGAMSVVFTGSTLEQVPMNKLYVGSVAGFVDPVVSTFGNVIPSDISLKWTDSSDRVTAQVGNAP